MTYVFKHKSYPPLNLLLYISGCSAAGSALDWGSRGRKFKSCHSDHVVASYISLATIFYRLALIPLLLLLSETDHAQVACSVVNALTTALFRYHSVSGCY